MDYFIFGRLNIFIIFDLVKKIIFLILLSHYSLSQDWVQLGSDIDGEAAGDNSGRSVALSSDGTIVAVGADKNDGNGNKSGHVRV